MEFNTNHLKRQIEEQPLIAAGVGAALLSGAARLLNAVTANKNSRTWAKEVARRTKKS
jgi:hypothetical protein